MKDGGDLGPWAGVRDCCLLLLVQGPPPSHPEQAGDVLTPRNLQAQEGSLTLDVEATEGRF